MPDHAKAKERRRRKELEDQARQKSAHSDLVRHSEDSKILLMPEGFNFLAGRDDPFLQSDVAIYHSSATRDFILKINGKVLGPFKKHELQCLRDCLRNDVDI
jgi:transcription termination factor Rho